MIRGPFFIHLIKTKLDTFIVNMFHKKHQFNLGNKASLLANVIILYYKLINVLEGNLNMYFCSPLIQIIA